MSGVVSIIGCGFVADLYMRSLQAMDGITVAGVYDKNPERLAQFCTFWNVPRSGRWRPCSTGIHAMGSCSTLPIHLRITK